MPDEFLTEYNKRMDKKKAQLDILDSAVKSAEEQKRHTLESISTNIKSTQERLTAYERTLDATLAQKTAELQHLSEPSSLSDQSQTVNFQLKGYDPSKPNDAQLADDWRLTCAKYATMMSDGKTEFETIGELEKFATMVLKEILKRGKITFHPEED